MKCLVSLLTVLVSMHVFADVYVFNPDTFTHRKWEEVVSSLPQNSQIRFDVGSYKLERSLILEGKRDLQVIGINAIIDGGKRPRTPLLTVPCLNEEGCLTKPWRGEKKWNRQYVDFGAFSALIIKDSQPYSPSGAARCFLL